MNIASAFFMGSYLELGGSVIVAGVREIGGNLRWLDCQEICH